MYSDLRAQTTKKLRLRKLKILLVDEMTQNLDLHESLLRRHGFEVIAVINGEEALKRLKTNSINLIISEIWMPTMDGFQLFMECKKDANWRSIPFIFYTKSADKEDVQFALDLGAEEVISQSKPPIQIVEIIKKVIKENPQKIQNTEALSIERDEEVLNRYYERLINRLETMTQDMAELRESEEQFQAIAQFANDTIITINHKSIIVFWNHKATIMFGHSADEIIGAQITCIMPERFQTAHIKAINTLVSSGKKSLIETPIEMVGLRKDGSEFPIEISIADWKTNQEGFYTAIIRDITERKQMDGTLARARDYLTKQVADKTQLLINEKHRNEAIIETVPVGILVFENDGSLSLANKTIKEDYWNTYHEELPVGYNCQKRADNIFLKTVQQLFRAKKGESITIEPKQGVHLQCFSAIPRFLGKRPFGAIIEVHDVTPFIEFEKLRNQFVSTVSHELRTPISVIVQSISNLERFKDRMTSELQEEIMQVMSLNAQLMTETVEELLFISRIDEQRIPLEWADYSPYDIVNEVIVQLDLKRTAQEIKLTPYIDQSIQLYGDPQKIAQIIRILVDNALKYASNGGTISITAVDNYLGEYNHQNQDGALIQVIDTGRGIPKEDLQYIFRRFYRSEDVSGTPGTGLGLAIAQELTQLHHGEIYVKSEYGKGSTFSVFLPRVPHDIKIATNLIE